MKQPLVAEMISVGTELLLGEIIDTNAAFLGERLRDLGIFVYRRQTLGDNLERLSRAIKEAMQRADLLILCGGLGPTDDDLTREAIAAAVGEEPFVDQALLVDLEAKFAARKRKMPEGNRKQAWLIKSARSLANPYGTAPGWLVDVGGKLIIALPGPPSELTRMWTEQVEKLLPASGRCLYHRTLHTIGIGESDLAERIKDFTALDSPGIGTYARNSGVDVRIAASGGNATQARAVADPVIREIELLLAPWIFGCDDETVVSAIKKLLDAKHQTFSCMESLTGGCLAAEITDCPGISSCFSGSITTYSAKAKVMAGVDAGLIDKFGVVSAEVAVAMAVAARKMFATDWGLSTTGVAGPDSLEGKSPGTAWVAVSGPIGEKAAFVDWPGDRAMIRKRVCRTVFHSFFDLLKQSA
ncbi:MAG TPA: competence/damage-inducible protein A [Candidatus Rifleibacterium sp.]|nr:competence/damage-inducible protein A [Candidatus Rifleibacterium sp.]HPT46010.1 competence/damage-inducible protein A [Candidatus Rifleibacterium sp.]